MKRAYPRQLHQSSAAATPAPAVSKKVVEVGLYLTAGQLRRLESLMVKWNVQMSVLPEPETPYASLKEWHDECVEYYGEYKP